MCAGAVRAGVVALARQTGVPWPGGWVISMQAELEMEVLEICSCYLPLLVAQGGNSGEGNCAPEFSATRIY